MRGVRRHCEGSPQRQHLRRVHEQYRRCACGAIRHFVAGAKRGVRRHHGALVNRLRVEPDRCRRQASVFVPLPEKSWRQDSRQDHRFASESSRECRALQRQTGLLRALGGLAGFRRFVRPATRLRFNGHLAGKAKATRGIRRAELSRELSGLLPSSWIRHSRCKQCRLTVRCSGRDRPWVQARRAQKTIVRAPRCPDILSAPLSASVGRHTRVWRWNIACQTRSCGSTFMTGRRNALAPVSGDSNMEKVS